MFCTLVKVLFAGSKMADFSSPWKGSYCSVPPLINTRPSGRATMALQNGSQFRLNCVKVPAIGSQSAAPELFEGPYGGPAGQPVCAAGQFPAPATMRTLPFLSSATWIGLIGIAGVSVLHCPVRLGWAVAR